MGREHQGRNYCGVVPEFRPDLHLIHKYRPGKPIEEVMRELGLDDVVKLASNELPVPPFPEVIEAIAQAAVDANRYPETSSHYVRAALADFYDLEPDNFWVGAGSSQLIGIAALAMGGPGRSILYADPSFSMYPIATRVAASDVIEVPVHDRLGLDLDAMHAAIRPDTRLIYVCNPNNPTGTYLPIDEVRRFIDRVGREILIIVDEAYSEFATAPDFGTAMVDAVERSNVVVARTFSKVFGLAGLRIGYFVGHPETLSNLNRLQPPFSVTAIAQTAAIEALRHPERLAERVETNAKQRDHVTSELAVRGMTVVPSQANFVMFEPPSNAADLAQKLLEQGVIVRQFGPWIRLSIGTPEENRRTLEAWDVVA